MYLSENCSLCNTGVETEDLQWQLLVFPSFHQTSLLHCCSWCSSVPVCGRSASPYQWPVKSRYQTTVFFMRGLFCRTSPTHSHRQASNTEQWFPQSLWICCIFVGFKKSLSASLESALHWNWLHEAECRALHGDWNGISVCATGNRRNSSSIRHDKLLWNETNKATVLCHIVVMPGQLTGPPTSFGSSASALLSIVFVQQKAACSGTFKLEFNQVGWTHDNTVFNCFSFLLYNQWKSTMWTQQGSTCPSLLFFSSEVMSDANLEGSASLLQISSCPTTF